MAEAAMAVAVAVEAAAEEVEAVVDLHRHCSIPSSRSQASC